MFKSIDMVNSSSQVVYTFKEILSDNTKARVCTNGCAHNKSITERICFQFIPIRNKGITIELYTTHLLERG